MLNPPSLAEELQTYYDAFFELDSCRTYVETVPMQIPWTAIQMYADVNFESETIKFELHYIIRAMDRLFIDIRTKKKET